MGLSGFAKGCNGHMHAPGRCTHTHTQHASACAICSDPILKAVALFVVATICTCIPCAHAARQYDHVLLMSLGFKLDIVI